MQPRPVAILFIGLALVAGSAPAATSNIVRVSGASLHPTGDLTARDSETFPIDDGGTLSLLFDATLEADQAFGLSVEFEHRFNDRFGLGVTLMRSDHDLDANVRETFRITGPGGVVLLEEIGSQTASGSFDMTQLLLGANYHFGVGEKVDLYAGPVLGYVTFGDVVLEGQRTAIKEDLAYGATLGLDVAFGTGRMAFSTALRYLVTKAEADEPDSESLDVDPFALTFGVGFNF